MILTVTPNFAVDLTYYVDRVRVGETTAVRSVARQAGGKGVNVARVLQALGREVAVTGLAGGTTGAWARENLVGSGLRDELIPVAGRSRTTLIIVDEDGEATGFSEPGPEVSATEWDSLVERFEALVNGSHGVALAGSLPPGVPIDGHAQLVSIAKSSAVPVLLDSSGDALARGLEARPDIVKVNAAELTGVVPALEVIGGAVNLRERGIGAIVITDGARGLVGVNPGGAWRAVPPEHLRGNPTGAGDAASAALISGVVDGVAWPQLLVDTAALSAAAVCAPLAGSFDEGVYRRLRAEIVAEEVAVR